MSRLSTLALVVCVACSGSASAQVVIRAPGVHVEVGSGVVVRAPFVNVVVPPKVPQGVVIPVGPAPTIPYNPPAPTVPPPVVDPAVPPVPMEEENLLPVPGNGPLPPPLPQARRGNVPINAPVEAPLPPAQVLPTPVPSPVPGTLIRPIPPQEFVAGFKPFKEGNYEVIFLHPCTLQPVKVCFELPVCPRRVNASKDRIDFRWGLLKGVSIIFERDGSVRIKKC
jgi:hypothetical protein